MKKHLHGIYLLIGKIYCYLLMQYWELRDRLFPPKEESVLFVAHPDDDSLFFYTFIKEKRPFVVLMTTGWSLIRLRSFQKAMRSYGARCRAYDMTSRDEHVDIIENRIRHILAQGNYKYCVTHNAEGEYGHMMHKQTHQAVVKAADIPVYVPADKDILAGYRLPDAVCEEKAAFIDRHYHEENWIINEHEFWIKHEKLVNYLTSKMLHFKDSMWMSMNI